MYNWKTPSDISKQVSTIEREILVQKGTNPKTKYKIITLFKEIKRLIDYQIPHPPIDIEDDGHTFRCPKCRTLFESEDHVSQFDVCDVCGQVWKEDGRLIEELEKEKDND